MQALYQGPAQSRHQARCTFPARYQWLEQQQGKAPPELNCPELKKVAAGDGSGKTDPGVSNCLYE
ncbi:DUF7843 domain-containing protein [Vibrio ostreae]